LGDVVYKPYKYRQHGTICWESHLKHNTDLYLQEPGYIDLLLYPYAYWTENCWHVRQTPEQVGVKMFQLYFDSLVLLVAM
jgi:hypothetical protein